MYCSRKLLLQERQDVKTAEKEDKVGFLHVKLQFPLLSSFTIPKLISVFFVDNCHLSSSSLFIEE